MLRRIGLLASLACTAAMFAGVSSAQAVTAGACVFTGAAGELTPIPNIIPDVTSGTVPGTLIDVERGTFHYESTSGGTAACAGVFEDTPAADTVDIESFGEYSNVLCGTGFAYDADGGTTTVEGQNTGISVSGAGYQIPFVAGVGPLLIGNAPNLANSVDPAAPDNITSPYTGVGVVHITPGRHSQVPPAHRDNCVFGGAVSPPGETGTTSSFEVAGFFVAAG